MAKHDVADVAVTATPAAAGNRRALGPVREGMTGDPEREPREGDVREVLIAEQAELRARAGALTRSLEDIVSASVSANADDEHDPEGSTIAFERAQVTALLAQATAHLEESTEALRRLDAGGYGQCEHCGAAIAEERLEARPTARTCIDCARSPKAPRSRPVAVPDTPRARELARGQGGEHQVDDGGR